MRLLLISLFSIVVLAGCSSAGETVVKPLPVPDVKERLNADVIWRQTVGDGLGKYYQKLAPALYKDAIYAADRKGKVFAFDKTTGKRLWRKNIKQAITGAVGVSQESVFIGTPTGEVIALARTNGEEQWRTRLSSEVLAPPQSNGVLVAVQTINGKVYGLNADDGEIIWEYKESLPVLTLRGTATPIVTAEAVIAAFANGKVIALNSRDGSLYWDQRIARGKGSSELERLVDIDGTPVLAGDVTFASSYQGNLVALNTRNGRIRWGKKSSSYQDPVVIGTSVFVSGAEGEIQAFDTQTGRSLWINKQLLRRKLSPPQELAGFLAVADFQGNVYIIDPEAGLLLTKVKIDGDGIRSKMISEDKVLYVLGNDGRLAAMSVKLLTQ